MFPIKLMITAQIKIGNCAAIAHRVSNPKKIKIPPIKCAGAI